MAQVYFQFLNGKKNIRHVYFAILSTKHSRWWVVLCIVVLLFLWNLSFILNFSSSDKSQLLSVKIQKSERWNGSLLLRMFVIRFWKISEKKFTETLTDSYSLVTPFLGGWVSPFWSLAFDAWCAVPCGQVGSPGGWQRLLSAQSNATSNWVTPQFPLILGRKGPPPHLTYGSLGPSKSPTWTASRSVQAQPFL